MNTENDIVEVYRREDGKFDWRRRDLGNGEVVSTSGGQGYEQRSAARQAAEDLNPGVKVIGGD